MLNKIILIGRITRDPELRYTKNGVASTQFSLAVESGYKTQEGEKEVDFINIQAWNKTAENCANYLAKGKMAAIEGRLKVEHYEDKEGIKRIMPKVIAQNVKFLSPKSGESGQSGTATAEAEVVNEDELPW